MRQTLHIFRKDVRHFWPEILLSLAVTAVFAQIYPAQWAPSTAVELNPLGFPLGRASLQTVASIATGLVPLAWFILIVRLVQDECLVGERPYWFTRPYEWPRLLAAKVLSLLLFVIVPFFAAQAWLLHKAGFGPGHYLPALFFSLLLNAIVFFVPLFCLATITRTFLRASLTLLGFFAFVGIVGVLGSEYLPSIYIPYDDRISAPVLLVVGITVIVVQYARRTTWFARSVLIVLTLTLTLLAINPLDSWMLEHTYYPPPAAQESQLPRLSLARDPNHAPSVRSVDKTHDQLTLPIDVSNIPYGSYVEPDDTQLRIVAADGVAWTSPWHSFYNHLYRQATETGTIDVQVDKVFLEHASKGPVSLELSVAVTLLDAAPDAQVTVPAQGDLVLPNFGRCTLQPVSAYTANSGNVLHCRYPMATPRQTLVTAFVTDKPCPAEGRPPETTFPFSATPGSLRPSLADFGLTSVWDADVPVSYSESQDTELPNVPPTSLCPGSLLTLAPLHVVRRARLLLTAAHYKLPRP